MVHEHKIKHTNTHTTKNRKTNLYNLIPFVYIMIFDKFNINNVAAFNVDPKPNLAFEGPTDSRFGFSLSHTFVENEFRF